MNNTIIKYIELFRKIKSQNDFKVSLLKVNILFVIIIIVVVAIESIFYLQPDNRLPMVAYTIFIYLTLMAYIGLKYLFNYNNLFNNSSNELIAKLIGNKSSDIKDRLINAYQLEEKLNKNNKVEYELSLHAINKIKNELSTLAISFNLITIHSLLKKFYIVLSIFLACIILFNNSTFPAINRLLHPQKTFKISLPFELTNISDNNLIFDGDTKKVSIAAFGDIPDSINLNYIIDNKINTIKITHENEVFNYVFKNIQSDIIWWSNVHSNSLFSPWDNIQSEVDTLVIIKRPIILDLSFQIIPPSYTGLPSYNHPSNMSNINFPLGSDIIIIGNSNNNLSSAGLVINNDTLFFNIQENVFSGEIQLVESSKATIFCVDNIFNQSSFPVLYDFTANHDMLPNLSIIEPEYDFELNESNSIILNMQISDDYGIKKIWIEYSIKKPSYIQSIDTSKYTYEVKDFNLNSKIQNIIHNWNISKLSLSPEDELSFTINVQDNNPFQPGITISKTFSARYPTLEDLFNQMENYEEDVENNNQELLLSVDEVQNMIDEVQLDLLKSDKLGWDEKQELDKAIDEMENIFNQIEEIQDVIEKIQEEADKNNLISDELMQKYDDFQNLLTEIMNPELLEAMEKIQDANQDMNLDDLLSELNNFEESLNNFEEQIDRFIDMFEQAIAEQKIDELVKKLENMLNEQSQVLDKINEGKMDFKDISSDERRIEEDYKNLENVMNDVMESSKKISPQTSELAKELIASELNKETSENIKNTRESLTKEDEKKSKKNAKNAKENLSKMLEKSKDLQNRFQNETIDKMISEFISVVNSIINISKYQDKLSLLSRGIRSSSPILPTIAKKQNQIRLQNKQLMEQILLLSRKTFYITPPIIRAIGKSSSAMDKSISHLEQKKSSQALKEQLKVVNGLNETAYLLLNSMEEMLSSGSASGFENFMEQLQQLSDKQQGVNEGTMQLPQLGMSGQQSMMQQLMGQQKALKEGLEQLLSNMPGAENTGLGQANKEMEEVINDFKRNKIDRITKEKQQKILSRMLDSQKSLTKKDYSNNRKSESYHGEILYDGPSTLTEGKGQKELLLINAMETALKENHSYQYKELIKLYFHNLQKEEND